VWLGSVVAREMDLRSATALPSSNLGQVVHTHILSASEIIPYGAIEMQYNIINII